MITSAFTGSACVATGNASKTAICIAIRKLDARVAFDITKLYHAAANPMVNPQTSGIQKAKATKLFLNWGARIFASIERLHMLALSAIVNVVKSKNPKRFSAVFTKPTRASVLFSEIEPLVKALRGKIIEREGSRVKIAY